MESEPESKRFKPSDYSTERIQISETFEKIINQIDIDSETILIRLNDTSELRESNGSEKQQTIQTVNGIRSEFIREIDCIRRFNLDNHSRIQQGKNTARIHQSVSDIYPKYCLYVDSQTVKRFVLNKDRLGVLIKTDFYISETQTELLSMFLVYLNNKSPTNSVISVNSEFLQVFHLQAAIIQAIRTDQYILDINKSHFSQIKEIKIEKICFCDNQFYQINYNTETKFTNLKILALNRLILEEINHSIIDLPTLEELDLSANRIKFIQKDSFSKLINLKRLDLSDNLIANIELGTFDNLTELERLNLSSNQLTNIKEGLFSNQIKLTELNLAKNKISIFKSGTFDRLSSLENLNLSHNECIFESNELVNSKNLKIMHLNYVTETPSKGLNILKLENLTELNYTYGHLSTAHLTWIKTLKNIRRLKLDIKHSTITNSFISNFNNLEELYISNSTINFNKIPVNLKNIRKITFNNAKFTQRAEILFKNASSTLEEINMIKCDFTVPFGKRRFLKNIQNVKKIQFFGPYVHSDEFNSDFSFYVSKDLWKSNRILTELDLTGIKLKTADIKSLRGLDNLEKLILKGNRLTRIRAGVFMHIKQIKYLDLSHNKISQIDKNAFKGFTNLEHLDISFNEMVSFDKGTFSDLKQLKHLDLSFCNIKKLHKNIFSGLNKLENLNVADNQLETLDDDIFTELSNLTSLELSGNKLNKVNARLFARISQLKELALSDNNLRELENVYGYLINLEKLYLLANKIEGIDLKSLSNLNKLRYLDLNMNEISDIDSDVLYWFSYKNKSFCEVVFEENPIFLTAPCIKTFDYKYN